jgi:hypothetical protein
VQILRGRLALIIENFKAYFLALSQIGKAGVPDRREVNKHLRSTGVRFYESVAFCRIKRLTVPVAIILIPESSACPIIARSLRCNKAPPSRKTRGSRYRGRFLLQAA